MTRGLLDTSVFIAVEAERSAALHLLPSESYVCVVTMAELEAGVLAAQDTEARARRLRTFESASLVEPIVIGSDAAAHWARLRYRLFEAGRRAKVNDLWIASVALSHDMPIVTQDGDFDVLAGMGGPEVIRI